MDFKAPFYWLIILRGIKALSDAVVAGHDDLLRANQQLATLLVGLEGVVVTPLLDVVTVDLLGAHLFDDDYLLSCVAIPPDVIRLDEGVRVCGSYRSGFAGTGRSPVPLILNLVDVAGILTHHLEQVD